MRGIEERIQQWSEYESSLERLLTWLVDAETSLKNYCLKNTLEEKQEQLDKYQVSCKLMKTLIEAACFHLFFFKNLMTNAPTCRLHALC